VDDIVYWTMMGALLLILVVSGLESAFGQQNCRTYCMALPNGQSYCYTTCD